MSYTNPDTLMEVANILDSFDEENLIEIFKTQINDTDSYTNLQINHLTPLYNSYNRALNIEEIEDDDLYKIKNRFQNICLAIIDFICAKFNIDLNDEWLNNNINKIPAIAMCLYQFFVLDIFQVILRSLSNYISKNIDDLFNAFADSIQGKDVSTITNLKIMDPKYAAIVSSMYDVTDYAFTMIDNETLLEYLGDKYIPGLVIKKLMTDNIFTGDFANAFANIYKENIALRSKITFELIFKIKEKGFLEYNPLIIREDQIKAAKEMPEPTKNTDISDDID